MKYQALIDADLADEDSINILLQSRDGRERLDRWLEHLQAPEPTPVVLRVDTQQHNNTTHKPFNAAEYARELQIRAITVAAGFIGLFIIVRLFS